MIDIEQAHLAIVKEILKKQVPNYEILVFGSRVQQKAKKTSDLDIVIRGKEKIDKKTLYKLQDELEDSDLPFRVDIIDWCAISKSFQNIIEQKYEVLSLET